MILFKNKYNLTDLEYRFVDCFKKTKDKEVCFLEFSDEEIQILMDKMTSSKNHFNRAVEEIERGLPEGLFRENLLEDLSWMLEYSKNKKDIPTALGVLREINKMESNYKPPKTNDNKTRLIAVTDVTDVIDLTEPAKLEE